MARRFILDNVVVVEETIHSCKKSGESGYLLKLDFEKAYDTVHWGAIEEVMQRRGFGPRWIGWIMAWLQSAKANILLNGQIGRDIICKRGLRQGDPLSPLIFNLVADGLNMMLSKARDNGLIQALGDTGNGTAIVNLQFADDTLLFCKANA